MLHNPGPDHDHSGTDDLARITGIGSKIAERLNAAGIATFAELAASSGDHIALLIPGMSPARVDSWREQAEKLAAEAVTMPAAAAPDDGQRYESFMIRVLLNEGGAIRRTTAQHIQTGVERHWAGLEREALADFIEMTSSAVLAGNGTNEPAAEVAAPDHAPLAPSTPEAPSTPRAHLAATADLLLERTVLPADEPFTMTLGINLSEVELERGRLAYSAVVVAKPLHGGPKRTVAQADGVFATTSPAIRIDAAGLPTGAYRLDGAVSFREPGEEYPMGLAALAEGVTVHVTG